MKLDVKNLTEEQLREELEKRTNQQMRLLETMSFRGSTIDKRKQSTNLEHTICRLQVELDNRAVKRRNPPTPKFDED